MELQPGQLVADYKIVRKAGEGGQAIVWWVEDSTGALWALKTTKPGNNSARLLRESDILREISTQHGGCPNIPRWRDFLLFKDRPYLVTERIEGKTMDSAPEQHLRSEHRVAILRQLAETLAFIHRRAIIHRDLQIKNVMISKEFYETPSRPGSIKLIDFGIAVQEGNERPLTYEGPPRGNFSAPAAPGSYPYMAPETLLADRLSPAERADPRLDIFAFGVLGWQLMTGQHPIGSLPSQSNEDYREAYREARASRRPWPVGDPNSPLTPVLLGCLQLEQELRPRDGVALFAMVNTILSAEGTTTHDGPAPTPTRTPSTTSHSPGPSAPVIQPAEANELSPRGQRSPEGVTPMAPPYQPSPQPSPTIQHAAGYTPAPVPTTLHAEMRPAAVPTNSKQRSRWLWGLLPVGALLGLLFSYLRDQPPTSELPSPSLSLSIPLPGTVAPLATPTQSTTPAPLPMPQKRCERTCTGQEVCVASRCARPPRGQKRCKISPDDTSPKIALHEKAHDRATIVRRYNAGSVIHLVTYHSSGWMKVEMSDGKEGFLRGELIECD